MTDKMVWWRSARFGMFIHWGPYARYGGLWNGREINYGLGDGYGEWIMFNAKIPCAEYAREASLFRPHAFDADALVRLARDAGMGYIVITAKHHDGFAMFHSRVSRYNIMDHAGFDRDPLAELSQACHRHGMRFGVYYSQAQDWYHPGGAAYSDSFKSDGDPVKGQWDPAQHGSFDDYLEQIAIPQVGELLTRYSPIDILWWDTQIGMTPSRAARFAPLLNDYPDLITNNRLSDCVPGDTETPEQQIPATGFKDRDWEVCMTLNDTWGYKTNDHNWKSRRDLLRKLSDIVSKGGNFLLNIGPDGEGRIPSESVQRLKEVGEWMRVNGEAVRGTTAGPFPDLSWGRCSRRYAEGCTTLYLHVFDWPSDGVLHIHGLTNQPDSVCLLGSTATLTLERSQQDLVITVPPTPPDPDVSVIALRVKGEVGVFLDLLGGNLSAQANL